MTSLYIKLLLFKQKKIEAIPFLNLVLFFAPFSASLFFIVAWLYSCLARRDAEGWRQPHIQGGACKYHFISFFFFATNKRRWFKLFQGRPLVFLSFLDTNADLFVINCANESINKALRTLARIIQAPIYFAYVYNVFTVSR